MITQSASICSELNGLWFPQNFHPNQDCILKYFIKFSRLQRKIKPIQISIDLDNACKIFGSLCDAKQKNQIK